VSPRGGDKFHNLCADNVPHNAFRKANVLVNGKAFDALQWSTRTLWEVKTSNIETYNDFVLGVELDRQAREALREQALAAACGFDFVIGVRTEAHKAALRERIPGIKIVVMNWC
jgi:uncharacterized protein DUF6310